MLNEPKAARQYEAPGRQGKKKGCREERRRPNDSIFTFIFLVVASTNVFSFVFKDDFILCFHLGVVCKNFISCLEIHIFFLNRLPLKYILLCMIVATVVARLMEQECAASFSFNGILLVFLLCENLHYFYCILG